MLLVPILALLWGCDDQSKFDQLLVLSNAKHFERRTSDTSKERKEVSVGLRDHTGNIQYVGTAYSKHIGRKIDVYLFVHDWQCGFAFEDGTRKFPIQAIANRSWATHLEGPQNGDFSDMLYRLSEKNHVSGGLLPEEYELDIVLYDPELANQTR